MQVTLTTRDNTVELAVSGELTSISAPELRPTFDDVVSRNPGRVVVDLSGLRIIDSSGVGALVSLFKRMRSAGGAFELTGVNGQPLNILRVLRLDRVFGLA